MEAIKEEILKVLDIEEEELDNFIVQAVRDKLARMSQKEEK